MGDKEGETLICSQDTTNMKDLDICIMLTCIVIYTKRQWLKHFIRNGRLWMWLFTSNILWIRHILREVNTIEAYTYVINEMFKDCNVNEGRIFVLCKFTTALDKYYNTNQYSNHLKKILYDEV